ncbi:LysR family transcriptional regulator [uncultured Limimaricola sp.]|uniref:LysR family transcriptional regulator n=1 Tax=uncultured Limimaricola sp. TaxID=2211667 RepID=UPI0030FA81C0
MDLRWLEDVLILLEERNLTRAAHRRNITQPAFSRRIRSFEDWIGAPVLNREVNRVSLDPALSEHEQEIRALTTRIRELRGNIANHRPSNVTVTLTSHHAPIHSKFPDLAIEARRHFPEVRFRLRAGNQRDCITFFLRGDASIFLNYEARSEQSPMFGASVKRAVCGHDRLVPVIGGRLRYRLNPDQRPPEDFPCVTYPEDCHFGEILARAERPFGTRQMSRNSLCETALSSGIKELVMKGLGLGWLPLSMCYRELESGEIVSVAHHFGHEDIKVVLYANTENKTAVELVDHWQTAFSLQAVD